MIKYRLHEDVLEVSTGFRPEWSDVACPFRQAIQSEDDEFPRFGLCGPHCPLFQSYTTSDGMAYVHLHCGAGDRVIVLEKEAKQ